jgi:hypothetical protein
MSVKGSHSFCVGVNMQGFTVKLCQFLKDFWHMITVGIAVAYEKDIYFFLSCCLKKQQ